MEDKRLENLNKFENGHEKKGGKKKGSIDVKTLIKKIANEEMEVEEISSDYAKRKVKRIKLEEGLRRQFDRWLEGDNKAGQYLIDQGWGKATDVKNITVKGKKKNPIPTMDYSNMTPEEIEALFNKLHNEAINEE